MTYAVGIHVTQSDTEIRPDLMLVHDEQADTILASLRALMSSAHPLSRYVSLSLSLPEAGFVIVSKP